MLITEVVVDGRTWWINADQHGHIIAMAAAREQVQNVDIAIAWRRPFRTR
ncbi:hypothetical protein [Phytoactinopolyspora halotolerans]|uniref:Uncharacterized protein n=1 Tax=Phytoactinopolyspora halotolerans TaxID=1981512 RepID=A0A6L9S8N9_9ACTN|nr:hypothetical protein [Phytoactinopolyspora halotolerans]NEE00964.1 hypothetical protein [Phytoactinopolyspora halotolerans]